MKLTKSEILSQSLLKQKTKYGYLIELRERLERLKE